MTRIRPAAWLMAAVALFLLAVAGYALLVHAYPQYYWAQIDAAVYRDGGIAVRHQPALLYALKRLDDGSYGRSVRSGVPIPDERLEADPAAELTVEEARQAERDAEHEQARDVGH